MAKGYSEMQHFLDANNISYNNGNVSELFQVLYFIGNDLEFTKQFKVFFDFNHSEYTNTIAFLENDLDSEEYYTTFTQRFQNYSFNKNKNNFIITSNGTTKHGKPYKIIISK